jgi:hypothetical protein
MSSTNLSTEEYFSFAKASLQRSRHFVMPILFGRRGLVYDFCWRISVRIDLCTIRQPGCRGSYSGGVCRRAGRERSSHIFFSTRGQARCGSMVPSKGTSRQVSAALSGRPNANEAACTYSARVSSGPGSSLNPPVYCSRASSSYPASASSVGSGSGSSTMSSPAMRVRR